MICALIMQQRYLRHASLLGERVRRLLRQKILRWNKLKVPQQSNQLPRCQHTQILMKQLTKSLQFSRRNIKSLETQQYLKIWKLGNCKNKRNFKISKKNNRKTKRSKRNRNKVATVKVIVQVVVRRKRRKRNQKRNLRLIKNNKNLKLKRYRQKKKEKK